MNYKYPDVLPVTSWTPQAEAQVKADMIRKALSSPNPIPVVKGVIYEEWFRRVYVLPTQPFTRVYVRDLV